MTTNESSPFENDIESCISPFIVNRSTPETNQLDADIYAKRSRIMEELNKIRQQKSPQAFSEVVSTLEHALNRIGDGYATIFVVDMLQKGQFDLPAWLGNQAEVTRTILGMTCINDMANIEKEQILYRDSIGNPASESILQRANRLQNLRSLSNMLKQPKGQKIAEGPSTRTGQMMV